MATHSRMAAMTPMILEITGMSHHKPLTTHEFPTKTSVGRGIRQNQEFLRQFWVRPAILRAIGEHRSQRAPFCRVRRTALKEHRFQIGETVYFTSRPIGHMDPNSTYEVVKLLPSDGSDYQYRIKNPKEAFERVARESQLEYTG
jgi:serine/threonine protein phosphatase PrpC